jgi:hypothetical protein
MLGIIIRWYSSKRTTECMKSSLRLVTLVRASSSAKVDMQGCVGCELVLGCGGGGGCTLVLGCDGGGGCTLVLGCGGGGGCVLVLGTGAGCALLVSAASGLSPANGSADG